MDVAKLSSSFQILKDQLVDLVATSAELIDRNSQIDSCTGNRLENLAPAPKFETKLEDFLHSCMMIELNLNTMQECIQQARASAQNLPVTLSNLKSDTPDANAEPTNQVSYNQYVTTVRYQVETAKAIRSTLNEFIGIIRKA